MSILAASFLESWTFRIIILVVVIALVIFLKWYKSREM